MTETTQKERDLLRLGWDRNGPICRALNDADRLAQIEQSLEALADRMRIADENLTHDGRHREAQFVRDWLSDVRAIIDALDAGTEDT